MAENAKIQMRQSEVESIIREIAEDVFEKLDDYHSEPTYRNAMEVGLRLRNIPYESERILEVKYQGFHVGTVRADLIVGEGDERVVVELKQLNDGVDHEHKSQLLRYMRFTGISHGILINFLQPKKLKIAETKGADRRPRFTVVPVTLDLHAELAQILTKKAAAKKAAQPKKKR